MATKIVTKSGSGAPATTDLVAGELAVDLTNKRLYTENGSAAIIEVGSNPYNFTANHDGSAKLATTATGIQVTGDIANASGDLTLDVAGDIILDAGGSEIRFSKAGTEFGKFATDISTPSQFAISSSVLDGDIKLQGNDGGSTITALTLDMSEAGAATFNAGATFGSGIDVTGSVTADGLTVQSGVADIRAGNIGPSSNASVNIGRADTSIASGNPLGYVQFLGSDNTAGSLTPHAYIGAIASSTHSAGSNPTEIVFGTTASSSETILERLKISDNGDLSLYEDTGTTPKFFWDAAAESLGIGTSSVRSGYTLDVQGANDNGVNIQTGDAASDIALSVGSTSTADKFVVLAGGSVGIGTSSIDGTLHVHTASAGTVSASSQADDLVIENSTEGGMTIITPDAQSARIRFTSPSTDTDVGGASIFYRQNINKMSMGTEVAGGVLALKSGAGSEGLLLDASGNVGINAVPEAWDSAFSSVLQVGAMSVLTSGGDNARIFGNAYYDGGATYKRINTGYAQAYEQTTGEHRWYNAASGAADSTFTWAESMRIDASGNLLVGKTASTGATVGCELRPVGMGVFTATSDRSLQLRRLTTEGEVARFYKDTTLVGTISVTATTTTYNTTSDQRLKENIADADDAGSKIDSIQVRKYDWKADGSHQDYGMVAQELLEVAPEAVSAPEDPEEMMAVDYSKLVPMMLKEIQSLRARIAALES